MLRASTQMMLCPADTNEKILKAMLSGFFGGATRNRTGDKGFADPCLTAWPWRRINVTNADANGFASALFWSGLRGSNPPPSPWQGDALPNELNPHRSCRMTTRPLQNGASGRNRTNDTVIFSHMLYQLSYRGKHSRLRFFFSEVATRRGLEPLTSSVTG